LNVFKSNHGPQNEINAKDARKRQPNKLAPLASLTPFALYFFYNFSIRSRVIRCTQFVYPRNSLY